MRIYIAGPMTGLPEWNYPAFADAEVQLQTLDDWRSRRGLDALTPTTDVR